MNNMREILCDYSSKVTDYSDKKILNLCINLIDFKQLMTDTELKNMEFIFLNLKRDYTLEFINSNNPLEISLKIEKQNVPMFRMTRNISIIRDELNRITKNEILDKSLTNVLCFLDASEHVEENEITSLEHILNLINTDWYMNEIIPVDSSNGDKYIINFALYRKQKIKKLINS